MNQTHFEEGIKMCIISAQMGLACPEFWRCCCDAILHCTLSKRLRYYQTYKVKVKSKVEMSVDINYIALLRDLSGNFK
jgi:hypothetical protein